MEKDAFYARNGVVTASISEISQEIPFELMEKWYDFVCENSIKMTVQIKRYSTTACAFFLSPLF